MEAYSKDKVLYALYNNIVDFWTELKQNVETRMRQDKEIEQ